MDKVLVYAAKNEMEASLVKGFLENEGLEVFTAKDLTAVASDHAGYYARHTVPQGLYVFKDKKQAALRLLERRTADTGNFEESGGRFLRRWRGRIMLIFVGVILLLLLISFFV